MSGLVCGLTGVTPEEPVYSKSGFIFEKRVIEKYLKTNSNVCPITGETLTLDDLYPIKAQRLVKPRPIAATSIPGLISLMQNEWDSLMNETFSLRNHLNTVRHQLSHALYQHDAGCRVIARLLKEKDSLKQQIVQLQNDLLHTPEGMGPKQMVEGGVGLSEKALEKLKDLAKSLLTKRKNRSLEGLTPVDTIKAFKETASYTLHSITSAGITTCCIDETCSSNKQVWTAGVDGAISLFDLTLQQTIARLIGHMKRVNHVVIQPSRHIVLSCSDDKTARVWIPVSEDITMSDNPGSMIEFQTSYILRKHTKPITHISLHPSGDYFTTASKDKSWGLHELNSGQTCYLFRDAPCTFKQFSFHPDGILVAGAGSDAKIHMYDLKCPNEPMIALEGHEGPITYLDFSENGYYLATASADNSVKLWDLRKSLAFETFNPVTSDGVEYTPNFLTFDPSGSYLAVCGAQGDRGVVALYYFESRTKLESACHLENHKDCVTSASFGKFAKYLVTSSLDRTVKLWEA